MKAAITCIDKYLDVLGGGGKTRSVRGFRSYCKYRAFTLIEILIAATVIGLISVLVLPSIVTKFQQTSMQKAFDKQITSLTHSLELLPMEEKVYDFTQCTMHVPEEPSDYENSSGAFLKKYFKINKYCGSEPGNCFASKYMKYSGNSRSEYKPFDEESYSGSCAVLKNGMSICIRPQVGTSNITGWIDTNGKKGPNIFGRDLRSFEIDPKGGFKMVIGETSVVWDTPSECPLSNEPTQKCCSMWQNTPSKWAEVTQDKKEQCCRSEYAVLTPDSICCDYFRARQEADPHHYAIPMECDSFCPWPPKMTLFPDGTSTPERCCESYWKTHPDWSTYEQSHKSDIPVIECCRLHPMPECCQLLLTDTHFENGSPLAEACCSEYPGLSKCSGYGNICGSSPSEDKASEECCSNWFSQDYVSGTGVVNNIGFTGSSVEKYCCENFEDFYDAHESYCYNHVKIGLFTYGGIIYYMKDFSYTGTDPVGTGAAAPLHELLNTGVIDQIECQSPSACSGSSTNTGLYRWDGSQMVPSNSSLYCSNGGYISVSSLNDITCQVRLKRDITPHSCAVTGHDYDPAPYNYLCMIPHR